MLEMPLGSLPMMLLLSFCPRSLPRSQKKYDGSDPNCATVGSSGHATGVPKVVTKGSKIVREYVATLLGLTTN
jgi:hypothetical protein